jgi:hypothetical protein
MQMHVQGHVHYIVAQQHFREIMQSIIGQPIRKAYVVDLPRSFPHRRSARIYVEYGIYPQWFCLRQSVSLPIRHVYIPQNFSGDESYV